MTTTATTTPSPLPCSCCMTEPLVMELGKHKCIVQCFGTDCHSHHRRTTARTKADAIDEWNHRQWGDVMCRVDLEPAR